MARRGQKTVNAIHKRSGAKAAVARSNSKKSRPKSGLRRKAKIAGVGAAAVAVPTAAFGAGVIYTAGKVMGSYNP